MSFKVILPDEIGNAPATLQPSLLSLPVDKRDQRDHAGANYLPYIYVLDADNLTAGQSYPRSQVFVENNDFYLRRICGIHTLANAGSTYTLLTQNGTSLKSDRPIRASGAYDLPVIPEEMYPPESSISLDLNSIALDTVACGGQTIVNSQIAFQGVARQMGNQTAIYSSDYPFIRKPYTYRLNVQVNTRRYQSLVTGVLTNPQIVTLRINDFDFEWYRLRIYRASTGAALATNDFRLRVFDPSGYRYMSNAPVNQVYLNSAAPNYYSCFPVPYLLYRVNSDIRFELWSMICNNDLDFPRDYVFYLDGVRRLKDMRTGAGKSPWSGVMFQPGTPVRGIY